MYHFHLVIGLSQVTKFDTHYNDLLLLHTKSHIKIDEKFKSLWTWKRFDANRTVDTKKKVKPQKDDIKRTVLSSKNTRVSVFDSRKTLTESQ